MRRRPSLLAAAIVLMLLLPWAAVLLHWGIYGYALFLLTPLTLGMIGVMIAQPESARAAVGWGALAPVIASLAFFLLGLEGGICILLAAPLIVPLGAVGGWAYYRMSQARLRPGATAMLLLIPVGTLGVDVTHTPPVYAVRTAIEINAPPERVWPHVVSYADMSEQPDWFFRAGVGYPQRVFVKGKGQSATRYCDFSTGPFVEPIEVWNEPRELRFRVTQNPVPMHEWSIYKNVEPKHLHGYFVSKEGQFLLTPLPGGRTLLEGTSWYQHGMWPAPYWRLWSDAIIHRVHLRVFNHIKALAENTAGPATSPPAGPSPMPALPGKRTTP